MNEQSRTVRRKPSNKMVAHNKTKAMIWAGDLTGCEPKTAAYAIRVWNGQSSEVPVRERVSRVVNALKGQGMVPA